MAQDKILDALLSAEGCPYEAGTVDSVVWMLGYKAGLERAKAMAEVAAGRAATNAPVVPDWRSPAPRHRKAH